MRQLKETFQQKLVHYGKILLKLHYFIPLLMQIMQLVIMKQPTVFE